MPSCPEGRSAISPRTGVLLCAAACWRSSTKYCALRAIYDEHEGLRDRFSGAGTVGADLAARLGLIGLAGRASAQAFDLRLDLSVPAV